MKIIFNKNNESIGSRFIYNKRSFLDKLLKRAGKFCTGYIIEEKGYGILDSDKFEKVKYKDIIKEVIIDYRSKKFADYMKIFHPNDTLYILINSEPTPYIVRYLKIINNTSIKLIDGRRMYSKKLLTRINCRSTIECSEIRYIRFASADEKELLYSGSAEYIINKEIKEGEVIRLIENPNQYNVISKNCNPPLSYLVQNISSGDLSYISYDDILRSVFIDSRQISSYISEKLIKEGDKIVIVDYNENIYYGYYKEFESNCRTISIYNYIIRIRGLEKIEECSGYSCDIKSSDIIKFWKPTPKDLENYC